MKDLRSGLTRRHVAQEQERVRPAVDDIERERGRSVRDEAFALHVAEMSWEDWKSLSWEKKFWVTFKALLEEQCKKRCKRCSSKLTSR